MTVAIIGAGITGLTLALALAKRTDGKLPIHLIEKTPLLTTEALSQETRTLAISHGSQIILEQLGVWDLVAPDAIPIQQIEVSEQRHVGTVVIQASDYKLKALGYVIHLQNILIKLQGLLYQNPNIELHIPSSVEHIEQQQEQVLLTLSNKNKISAKLVLLANGMAQEKKQLFKLDYQIKELRQVAVVANVTTELANQGRAYERFTQQGPLALLPMGDYQSALVWCQNYQYDELSKHWDERQFLKELQEGFGWRLGKIRQVSHKGYFPLYQRYAKQISYHRIALLGNAAQTLHPVAGQGFNLALRDIDTLSKLVAQANLLQQDYGSFDLLQRYANQRKPDRENLIQLTNGFISIFSNDYLPLQFLRSAGLMLLSQQTELKTCLVRKMLG